MRFPGFTEPWQRTTFKEICKITTGSKNTQDKVNNGLYPFYVRSQTIERINEYTFDGEAILTAGDGVGVGKVFHYSTGKIGVHQRVYLLTDFKCDGKYLFHYFSSKFYNRVKRMSAKNSVDSVRMEMIAEMPISLPSIKEQQIIGTLLSKLDERIATQRRLIDKLETLIKGVREHCLKNISGEMVYLSSIAEIYQPQTISSLELVDNGFPIYGANGIIGYYNSYNHETEQICITCRGNTCGTVNYSLAKSWITGNAMVVNTDSHSDIVCKRFLFHFLSEYNFKSIISGSGQPQIVRSPLQKLKVKLPSLDKQSQIANFLDAILHKTDLEYSELNLLQKQRQHLLQRMFI